MIINMRRYMKSDAYRTAMVVAVIALIASMALPPIFKGIGEREEWVVQANNQTVSLAEFQQKVAEQQQYLALFRQQYGPYADLLLQSMGMSADPRELAFRFAVQDALMSQVASDIGIQVHDDVVTEKLNDFNFVQRELGALLPMYVFQNSGQINQQALRRHLKRIGMTVSDFDAAVEGTIARNMLTSFLASGVYATDAELKQQFINEQLGKKFTILTFSFEKYLKKAKEAAVSDDELQQFFDTQNRNAKRYWIPEKRGGVSWKFSPNSYGITISDADIEAYYEDHKTRDYVDEPSKVQVRRILFNVEDDASALGAQSQAVATRQQLLIDPTQFATKAKELSADSQTAAQGGLVDWFAQGEKDAAFERAAFLLKEDGDISEVIRTQDGFEILQRVGKKPRTYIPLAKVKSEIKELLTQRKFKKEFVEDMEEALRSANQEEAIMRLVKERGGKQEQVAPLDNDSSPLARALFGIKKDDMTFYAEDKDGFAVKVTTIQDGYMPTLNSIKQVVTDDLYEERATRALRQEVDKAKVEAQSKPMREVATMFGASVQETDWVKRDDTKAVKALEDKGVPAERVLQIENIGALFTYSADKDGLVVRLDAVQDIDPAAFEAKRAEINSAVSQEKIPLIMQGFVASLRRNATIKVNESVLNLYQ